MVIIVIAKDVRFVVVMKIEFQQINKHKVLIIGVDEKSGDSKIVGHIVTPSGSGNDYKNAIQICGFSEAFDLRGCGIYGKERKGEEEIGNPYMMGKDISLMFEMEMQEVDRNTFTRHMDFNKDCIRCFNKPCTCEVKIKGVPHPPCPYIVKGHAQVPLEKIEERKSSKGNG